MTRGWAIVGLLGVALAAQTAVACVAGAAARPAARVVRMPAARTAAVAAKPNPNAPPPPQTLAVSVPKLYPAFQGALYYSDDEADRGPAGGTILYITGGTAPYTCALTSGALPAGMTLAEAAPPVYPNGVCELTGTPAADGDFPLTVEASDAASHTGSASLTFVVRSSSPPTISAPAATSVSATSETISWTTNVPASSKVCYNLGNAIDRCTAETDTGGVTAHSVTLTGLIPNTHIQYIISTRGIANGAPQDYLVSTYGDFNGTVGFNTPSAPAGSPTTLEAYGVGPHDVTAGHSLYVGVDAIPVLGPDSSANAVFTVTGLPPDTAIRWPDQQDNGSLIGQVSTTYTPNDTITFSGTNGSSNTQFRLLTNQGGTTPTGSYTVTVNYSVVKNAATESSGSFGWAVNVQAPASFTPTAPVSPPAVPDLALWQSQMTNAGNVVPEETYWYNGEQRGGACDWPSDPEGDDFYDGAWVYDQIGAYTNNTAYWITGGNASPCPSVDTTTASLVDGVNQGVTSAGSHVVTPASMTGIAAGVALDISSNTGFERLTVASATSTTFTATFTGTYPAGFTISVDNTAGPQGAAADVLLYHQQLVQDSYQPQLYFVSPQGLYYACKVQGATQSCTDLHDLAAQRGASSLLTNYGALVDTDNTREAAYNLELLRLDYDAGGASTLANMKQDVDYILGHIDTVLNGTALFEQAFMDGLEAQSLIDYYMDPRTGNQADARIPIALEALANHLWTTEWLPRAASDGMFFYNVTYDQIGMDDNTADGSDMRALNLMIAPMYAWLYAETGQAAYQQEGDVIWDSGVTTYTGGGIGWSGKNFNEQYRWSFAYAKWRGAAGTYLNPW